VLELDAIVATLAVGAGDEHDPWPAAHRALAATAREHLAGGRDVVVPQLLTSIEDVERLEDACIESGGSLHETVLDAGSPAAAAARFRARAARAETPQHRDAPLALAGGGSGAEFAAMAGQLAAVLRARPRTHVFERVDDDVEATFAALLVALGDGAPAST
jgi:hypothetical protein